MSAELTLHDAIAETAASLPAEARALRITSDDDYARVAEFVLGAKALRAEIAATFDPHIARAYETHRGLCAAKRQSESAVVMAETIAKALLTTWETAATAKRAHALAEAETAATAAAADLLLHEAIAAIDAGDPARAEAVLELPGSTTPASAPPAVPKIDGLSYRDVWSAKVVDFPALVRAATEYNTGWLALLLPNMPALHAQARSLRTRLRIPGVEAICTRTVAATGRPSKDPRP